MMMWMILVKHMMHEKKKKNRNQVWQIQIICQDALHGQGDWVFNTIFGWSGSILPPLVWAGFPHLKPLGWHLICVNSNLRLSAIKIRQEFEDCRRRKNLHVYYMRGAKIHSFLKKKEAVFITVWKKHFIFFLKIHLFDDFPLL